MSKPFFLALWLNPLRGVCWAQSGVLPGAWRPSAWAGVEQGLRVTRRQQGRANGAWILHEGKSDRCLPAPLPPKCLQAGPWAEDPSLTGALRY